MEGSNGYLAAGDLVARGRREVELPSGGKVLVRRIGRSDLAGVLKGFPDVTAMARIKERGASAAPEDLGRIGALIEGVLLRGVVAPRLFEDPAQGPTPNDFSAAEQDLLFDAITGLSGWNRAEAARGNG